MAEEQKHEPKNDDMQRCFDIVFDRVPIKEDTQQFPWDYDSYSDYRKHRRKKTTDERIANIFANIFEFLLELFFY